MRTIKLTQNKHTLVDDEDFEVLSKYKWCYHKKKTDYTGYAVRSVRISRNKIETITLHSCVLNIPIGMVVDHINRDGLDNRKENLRIATVSQNAFNRKLSKNNKSGYKGVSWNKGSKKWQVFIIEGGKNRNLGSYDKVEDAAKVYNDFSIQLHKEFYRNV